MEVGHLGYAIISEATVQTLSAFSVDMLLSQIRTFLVYQSLSVMQVPSYRFNTELSIGRIEP